MHMIFKGLLSAVALLTAAGTATAAEAATARMVDAQGADVGTVDLREIPQGVLIQAHLKGLPPGVHGFHLHTVGKCEAPFDSAGAHFNPGHTTHGLQASSGGHAGDLTVILTTLKAAARHGVQVGAHPGFLDREHFGRRELKVRPEQVKSECDVQIALVKNLAELAGVQVRYPSGAPGFEVDEPS